MIDEIEYAIQQDVLETTDEEYHQGYGVRVESNVELLSGMGRFDLDSVDLPSIGDYYDVGENIQCEITEININNKENTVDIEWELV